MRLVTLAAFVVLAALPARAAGPYSLEYKASMPNGRFAFDITVRHTDTGTPILRSTLRTRPREWGELSTGHAGRTIRVRAMGEVNGYAALVLDVHEQNRSIQHEVFRYTELAAAPPVRWTGEKISVHLRDADLVDVLLAFAKITGTNIAVDPGVSGSVTIDLVDVPSDQALDLIIRQYGLARQVSGNVTFVKAR
jgi:hypothetical protein